MQPLRILAPGLLLAAGLAAPALAASVPATRLVECGAQSCLLVSGSRADRASAIRINGHSVAVQGGRKWRAIVPVGTLRDWSQPYARTIDVAIDGAEAQADLPIGLLGHATDLAMVTVRVK